MRPHQHSQQVDENKNLEKIKADLKGVRVSIIALIMIICLIILHMTYKLYHTEKCLNNIQKAIDSKISPIPSITNKDWKPYNGTHLRYDWFIVDEYYINDYWLPQTETNFKDEEVYHDQIYITERGSIIWGTGFLGISKDNIDSFLIYTADAAIRHIIEQLNKAKINDINKSDFDELKKDIKQSIKDFIMKKRDNEFIDIADITANVGNIKLVTKIKIEMQDRSDDTFDLTIYMEVFSVVFELLKHQ